MKSERTCPSAPIQQNGTEQQFLQSILLQLSVFFKSVVAPIPSAKSLKDQVEPREKRSLRIQQHEQKSIHPNNHMIAEEKVIRKKRQLEPKESPKKVAEMMQESKEESLENEESSIPSIEEVYPNEVKRSKNNTRVYKEDSESEEYQVKTKKKRRRRGARNANSPKKPVSSFVHYYAARTKVLRKEHPEGVIGNLAKILSAQWKSLSEKQKEPYIRAAQQSLEIYYQEKENGKMIYRPKDNSQPSSKISEEVHNKQIKESLLDDKSDTVFSERDEKLLKKGPLSNFFIFFKTNCDRIAQKYNENQRGKLAKLASEEWSHMSSEDKRVYTNMAKVERRRRQRLQKQLQLRQQELNLKRTDNKNNKANDYEEYKPKKSRTNIQTYAHSQKDASHSESLSSQHQINQDPFKQYLKQRPAKLEPDKSCEMKIIMEEENDSIDYYLHNKPEKMIEQSENQPESLSKPIDKNSALNFIEVNSNDEGYLNNSNDNAVFGKDIITNLHKEKTPVNAFLIYYQQTLKDLKAVHTKVLGSELVKIASSKWSELNEEEKMIYYNLARQRRKNHELYLKNQQGHTVLTKSRLRGRKTELAQL